MRLAKRMRRLGMIAFALMGVSFGIFIIGIMTTPVRSDFDGLPLMMQASLLLGFLLAVPMFMLLFGSNIPRTMAERSLRAKGLPADARVIEVWETGMRINRKAVVRILLQVRPPYQQPFEAETERLMSFTDPVYLHPGAVVQVKYDPESKEVTITDN